MIRYLIDKLNRLEWRLMQLRLQIKEPFSYYACVEKRVPVEQLLFNVANGKRDLLTREECRKVALYLGDPTRTKLDLK